MLLLTWPSVLLLNLTPGGRVTACWSQTAGWTEFLSCNETAPRVLFRSWRRGRCWAVEFCSDDNSATDFATSSSARTAPEQERHHFLHTRYGVLSHTHTHTKNCSCSALSTSISQLARNNETISKWSCDAEPDSAELITWWHSCPVGFQCKCTFIPSTETGNLMFNL